VVPARGADPVIAFGIATLSLLIWMALFGSGFWRTDINDTRARKAEPAIWPSVVAIVPARDEADVITRSVGSLATQDYPGSFSILLVDDNSSDDTAAAAGKLGSDRLAILPGAPLAQGWTGKLWAVSQGVAASGTPDYLWLTDADIEHVPDTLRTLVGIAQAGERRLVSLMAKLRCDTPAERALIPAFVFFFQMLYPFAWVNRPRGIGAAAGGCVLVRRDALEAAGGIAAIRDALIDDCTLGSLIKRQGPIWLGLTNRSRSIRPYVGAGPIVAMIARSAYAQLDYSPLKLIGTIVGLALVYFAPPVVTLFASGWARWLGLGTWLLMAASFQPMLRFYRRSPLWGLALPGIAAFYAWCTILSAWHHARGRGGMWKGRVQAAVGR
jgi:hopene-associated glycosyltransferase HpnB